MFVERAQRANGTAAVRDELNVGTLASAAANAFAAISGPNATPSTVMVSTSERPIALKSCLR